MTPSPTSRPSVRTSHRTAPRHRRLLALAAVCLLTVGVAACSSGTSPSAAGTGGGSRTATGDTIVIKNFAFSPGTLVVTPGETITVRNEDNVAHTVTSTTGRFATGPVQPGTSTTITAPNAPGTYPYICSIHQYMTGTLTVRS